MSTDISTSSTLLIVSDTAMWQVNDEIWVFEPTLREVEWLGGMVKKITWIGYGYPGIPKSFARATSIPNIEFILLPYARGGNTFFEKLKILPFIPSLFFTILKHLRKNKFVHTRGPSVPALLTILISYFDTSRTYWHKYAGNWVQDPAPKAYGLQRFLLRHNKHKVSVNGSWPDNPANFVSLENPCLTNTELKEANSVALNKTLGPNLTICFVGGLVKAKGIHQFMDALALVEDKAKIKDVFIAGDGAERPEVERRAKQLSMPIHFLGNIKRDALNTVYANSDIIVLPSATEGFPKVIAEAAAFGCIPLVTNVSSIGQYVVDKQNGMLLKDAQPETIAAALDHILSQNEQLTKMKTNVIQLSQLFTYERYCSRISAEVFFDPLDESHQ
jgi:glycosyltransferase involved in cell wall biosynthesis